jgi:transcriptional regulator with XRE-family HTH domain
MADASDGIGASVRLRRVEAGIRQDHLAARVGISPSHLSRFERGMRHVSVATLEAIVHALIELGVQPWPELSDADGSSAADGSSDADTPRRRSSALSAALSAPRSTTPAAPQSDDGSGS